MDLPLATSPRIFVDEISWLLYWISGLLFALLFLLPNKKVAGTVVILLTLSSAVMFVPTLSHDIAKSMLSKEPFHIVKKPWTYKGILLYEGRYNYYLLDEETQKTITFTKDEIDEAY